MKRGIFFYKSLSDAVGHKIDARVYGLKAVITVQLRAYFVLVVSLLASGLFSVHSLYGSML
jgi:hypothetical protein